MKVKPFKEEVIELVLQFLEAELGESDVATELREKHLSNVPEWILEHNALVKKGLTKVVKSFVQMDKKIKQYYVRRRPASDDEGNDEAEEKNDKVEIKAKKTRKTSVNSVAESEKPSKKKAPAAPVENSHSDATSTWVKNKFEAPKKLENIGKEEKKSDKTEKKVKPSMIAKEASSEESEDRPIHSEEESEEIPKKKSKAVINKKAAKKVESEEESSEEVPQKNHKKVGHKNVGKKSESEEESEEEVQKPIIKEKKKVKAEKKEEKKEEKKVTKTKVEEEKPHRVHTRSEDKIDEEENDFEEQKHKGHKNNGVISFSRINVAEVGPIPEKLRDNSFEAKFKFGKGGDAWGKYGNEKLKDTRGESFKKTKDKLKNQAFQGANIDFNIINSIPL